MIMNTAGGKDVDEDGKCTVETRSSHTLYKTAHNLFFLSV